MGITSPAVEQRRFRVGLGLATALVVVFGTLLHESRPGEVRLAASALGLLTGGLVVSVSGGLAARRSTGPRRLSWLLLTAAALVALAGNVWSTVVGADPVSSPSLVAEACIAVALLLSIAGLLNLPTMRHRGIELLRIALDGLVVGGSVLMITSLLGFLKVLGAPAESGVTGLAAVVFPVLDLVLATVALLLVVRSRADRAVLALLGLGFSLYAAGDLAFAARAAHGEFEFGTLLDLAWIAGYLLIAAAAWHPSASRSETVTSDTGGSDVQSTLMVFGILAVAVVVQVFAPDQGPPSAAEPVLWLVLVAVAGLRQTMLTIDNVALRRGLERRVQEQTADLSRLARQTEVLLTSVGDGIYGVDPAGDVTFVNPSGAEALGYGTGDLLGAHAHTRFHGPRPDGTAYDPSACYITEAIEQGVISVAEEDTYLRRDGETIPVEITASPLVDGDRISGAVVVFRDMTQRREVERMKNEFLSVVSHELRTPLTSIRGSLGLLAGGRLTELSPQAERMVGIALESSERLTRLINDILDIERIESGSLPIDPQPHQARDLLEAAATEMSGLAGATGVRLETGEASGRVMADADRIVQTLTNLLGNAIKYSPPGGVVQLSAVASGEGVTFAVRDTGRGIPAEKLESIFERFEQVDSSDSRQKGGTGLGLAISKGIVERHGGTIWAESTLGEGATVRFTLPRLPEKEQGYVGVAGAVDAPLVLVCDDDLTLVDTFTTMLARHGYRAVGVTSGEEALERVLADRPAAVIVDLLMPQTSGGAVVESLKASERTRHIPVVVISGLVPAADPDLAATAEDWLVKPVSEELLVQAVAHAVEGRRRDSRVLVVEDDEVLAGVVVSLLSSHGLDVAHAVTVAEAVELASRSEPDVVVLDLRLPDGDGAELVNRLRADGVLSGAAVVVYSAADLTQERRAELGVDATDVLTKGRTGPEELEDRVLRLVDAVTGRSAQQGGERATGLTGNA
jgi:PAS domain S-box-containing protein